MGSNLVSWNIGAGGLVRTYFLYASIQLGAISRWAVFQIQLAGAYELVEFPLEAHLSQRSSSAKRWTRRGGKPARDRKPGILMK